MMDLTLANLQLKIDLYLLGLETGKKPIELLDVVQPRKSQTKYGYDSDYGVTKPTYGDIEYSGSTSWE